MRGGRHYCRGGACRAIAGQPPGSGPACGASGEPVNKSCAQQHACADVNRGTEGESIAELVAHGRTGAGCLAWIGNGNDAIADALSWTADPFAVAYSLSPLCLTEPASRGADA